MDMTGSPQTQKPPRIPDMSITTTMTPEGRVLNVEGLDKMMAASGVVLQGMNSYQMINSVMKCNVLFPAEPVDVGSNWKQVVPMPFGKGDMRVSSTLTAIGEQIWSQSAAKITQTFDAQMDLAEMIKPMVDSMPAEARSAMSSMSGRLDLVGSMDYLFSPAMGKLLTACGDMTVTTNMKIPAEAVKSGAPSEISMDMDMKISLTRFK